MAHGWYDTRLECETAKILRYQPGSLDYTIRPTTLEPCIIHLYGVREDGVEARIAVYRIEVNDE